MKKQNNDCELLFFILIFLLLFYDNRPLQYLKGLKVDCNYKPDCSILFFILIFLELFY